VVFNNFGASSIDFDLFFWVDTEQNGLLAAKDAAVVVINNTFTEKGIEIPYPVQRVITK
jgi:small-conductance mechanosensitive channel